MLNQGSCCTNHRNQGKLSLGLGNENQAANLDGSGGLGWISTRVWTDDDGEGNLQLQTASSGRVSSARGPARSSGNQRGCQHKSSLGTQQPLVTGRAAEREGMTSRGHRPHGLGTAHSLKEPLGGRVYTWLSFLVMPSEP